MEQAVEENKLVDARRCIDAIFHKGAGPGLRTWLTWKAKGVIPFVKVGRRVFYNVDECKKAINKFSRQNTPVPLKGDQA